MDESLEYVLMCKMATEIQNEYGGTPNSFYVSIDSDPDGIHKETIYFGTINTLPKGSVYWIPRQDELQAMLRTKNLRDLLFHNHKLIQDYMSQIEGYNPDTMEQAWIMLVMNEKYGKVWNGEYWYNPYEVEDTDKERTQ